MHTSENRTRDAQSAAAKTTPSSNGVAADRGGATIAPRGVKPQASAEEVIDRAGPRCLADTFLDERDDVLTVVNELEDQLDRYEQVRTTLEKSLAESQTQLQTARHRIQELEWQKSSLETRVELGEQTRREVANLEEELADAAARMQRIAEKLATTEKENSRLTEETRAAAKQLEELWATRKERDGLRNELRAARAGVEQLQQTARTLGEERAALASRADDTQRQLDESRAAHERTEAQLRIAEDRAAELDRVQQALEQKIDAMRADAKAAQAQITHLERENARFAEQRKHYEGEVSSLRTANRSVEAALAGIKQAFAEVRIALSDTKARTRRRGLEPAHAAGDATDVHATADAGRVARHDAETLVGAD